MMSLLLSLALAATGSDSVEPAKPAKPKKVCQKVEITGSTVPKRVCRTVVETAPPKEETVRSDTDKPQQGATN